MTKQCRRLMWFYTLLDWIICYVPLIVYSIWAVKQTNKIGMVSIIGFGAIALIIGLLSTLAHKKLNSPKWLIVLGLFIAIGDKLLWLVVIMAVCAILDDILTEVVQYYKTKYIANKAIDERE